MALIDLSQTVYCVMYERGCGTCDEQLIDDFSTVGKAIHFINRQTEYQRDKYSIREKVIDESDES